MNVANAIAVAFLVVSMAALGVQSWALWHLRVAGGNRWLTRTAICRVACAVLYVGIGVNALTAKWAVLQVSFLTFCATQATWQVNALMDAQMSKRKAL